MCGVCQCGRNHRKVYIAFIPTFRLRIHPLTLYWNNNNNDDKKNTFLLKIVRLLFVVILVCLNQIINVSNWVTQQRCDSGNALQWHRGAAAAAARKKCMCLWFFSFFFVLLLFMCEWTATNENDTLRARQRHFFWLPLLRFVSIFVLYSQVRCVVSHWMFWYFYAFK